MGCLPFAGVRSPQPHTHTSTLCWLLQVFTGAVIVSPLLISILWCLYNMIPPVLVFTYAIGGRKYSLGLMSLLCMLLSVGVVVGSLALVWWIQVPPPPRPPARPFAPLLHVRIHGQACTPAHG